ncbi:MAG TPA: 4Fe-4S binding protein [Gammaproteobacteria bacterium]|nr:4Fe-4S binding protein [Gammaproteobacteria bacterium]
MNKALQDIPVVAVDADRGQRIHAWRRALQLGSILLAILIPVSGLFRIDPVEGAFVVLDRQVWFSDFYLVVGLWLAISCFLVMTYSLVGTAFCGWICPQNTLSEWANRMTQRWLGKRAEVSLDGTPMRVSQGKNKWSNWLLLGTMFVLAAMGMALIPLFYFYPPDVIWSFVTFKDDPRLAGSLHWIYTIFVLIIAVDIAFIRHFWCRFMCVYRVWQHTFKTRETLHIAHDDSRAEECERCNFCVTACFIGIDPRRTETYDACINCGECITACSRIRASRKTGGSLLRFEVGDRRGRGAGRRSNLGSIVGRAPWATALMLLGLAMFSWGLWSYDTFHFSVYHSGTGQGGGAADYRISLANKLYRPASLRVEIAGLPAQAYTLSESTVNFDTAGRQDLNLHISGLSPGLHPFVVTVAADGIRQSFRVNHYVPGKPQT